MPRGLLQKAYAKKPGQEGGASTNTAEVTVTDLLQAAKTTKFDDREAVVTFTANFRSMLCNPPENDAKTKEALHILAGKERTELQEYEPFLRWVCKDYPGLFECKHGGLPPLHLAIQSSNAAFVRIVLDGSTSSKTLFEPKDTNHRTCLHFAIQQKSHLTRPIIEKAKKLLTLGVKDDVNVFIAKAFPNNQTPLHLAVIHRPDEEEEEEEEEGDGSEVEGDVSDRAASASDTWVKVPEAIPESAAINIRDFATSSREKVIDSGQSIPKRRLQDVHVPDAPIKTDGFPRDAPAPFPDEVLAHGTKDKSKRLTRSMSFKNGLADTESEKSEPYRVGQTIKDLIDAMDGALLERDSSNNTPYQAIVSELEKTLELSMKDSNESRETHPEVFEIELRQYLDNGDLRAKIIRKYCIRNMTRDDALKALYKVGDERVIEFDLSQLLSSTIDADFLKGLAKVLRFETVLSYVALPRLSIQDDKDLQKYLEDMEIDDAKNEEAESAKTSSPENGKAKNGAQEPANQGIREKAKSDIESAGNKGKGLTSLCPIFRWLRNLNVSSIVKITVIDDVEPSHSDAAIEACLEGFNIERWNWKKFDICSDVILKAAPNVKHVILYSSGNNAVLLGWASSAGLCKLKKLKSVYVVVREGLESGSRLNKYIEDFKTTLKSHDRLKNITVECTLDDPTNSLASVFVDKDVNPENNLWLQYMKDFAKFLQNVKPRAKPIYIAVIDDGINTKLDTFADKIHCGDSFYDPALDPFHGRRGVYYVPSGRHGTLMAQLICNICPVVKLFVAQLQVAPGRDQQRSFTTRSAVKAIEWAVNRKVDIISMSWSIDDTSDSGAITDLKKALLAAHTAGILMFCSCIDRGAALKDETLPGCSGYAIRIGAARASGEKLPWVAGPQSEYLLPGENIKPEEPDAWSHHRSGPFGSSIATALATGLAGALLYCDRLLGCTEKFMLSDRTEVDYLRDKSAMDKVLDRMSTETDGRKFIEVRNNLQKYLPEPKDILWNRGRNNEVSDKAKKRLQSFMNAMKGHVST